MATNKTCIHCGKPMTGKKHPAYCSKECWYDDPGNMGRERRCLYCGKKFTATKVGQMCCGKSCSAKFREQEKKKEKKASGVRAPKVYAERICPVCKKKFKPASARQIYCTPQCRKVAIGCYTNPEGVERTCVVCGKTYITPNSRSKFCSPECEDKYNGMVKNCKNRPCVITICKELEGVYPELQPEIGKEYHAQLCTPGKGTRSKCFVVLRNINNQGKDLVVREDEFQVARWE